MCSSRNLLLGEESASARHIAPNLGQVQCPGDDPSLPLLREHRQLALQHFQLFLNQQWEQTVLSDLELRIQVPMCDGFGLCYKSFSPLDMDVKYHHLGLPPIIFC